MVKLLCFGIRAVIGVNFPRSEDILKGGLPGGEANSRFNAVVVAAVELYAVVEAVCIVSDGVLIIVARDLDVAEVSVLNAELCIKVNNGGVLYAVDRGFADCDAIVVVDCAALDRECAVIAAVGISFARDAVIERSALYNDVVQVVELCGLPGKVRNVVFVRLVDCDSNSTALNYKASAVLIVLCGCAVRAFIVMAVDCAACDGGLAAGGADTRACICVMSDNKAALDIKGSVLNENTVVIRKIGTAVKRYLAACYSDRLLIGIAEDNFVADVLGSGADNGLAADSVDSALAAGCDTGDDGELAALNIDSGGFFSTTSAEEALIGNCAGGDVAALCVIELGVDALSVENCGDDFKLCVCSRYRYGVEIIVSLCAEYFIRICVVVIAVIVDFSSCKIER